MRRRALAAILGVSLVVCWGLPANGCGDKLLVLGRSIRLETLLGNRPAQRLSIPPFTTFSAFNKLRRRSFARVTKAPTFGFELEGDPPTEADSGRTCARLIEPRFRPGLLLSCNARKEIADALSLARQQLFALMFIPHMDDRLNELAALAEPEEWDYHRTETEQSEANPVQLSALYVSAPHRGGKDCRLR